MIDIPQKVHFVGIGGIGMSALAQHLVHLGFEVSGSDRQENEQTQKLRSRGVKIFVPHSAQNVGEAQLVVRTSAVPQSNEEVAFAHLHNIPVLLREELLGKVFDEFPTRIAICGTHGKTTVTAMIHHILERCGVPHAAFIGGEFLGENYFCGNGIVVAEACEYNRSFLHLHPTLCACVNIEFDHPDCYKDFLDVQKAFEQLFSQSDDVVGVGAPSPQKLQAKNIETGHCVQFDLLCSGEFVQHVKMRLCGKHNVDNALVALSVAEKLKLPLLQAVQAICTFSGVSRRWTEVDNCPFSVVCDYAHHPTEIATTVATAKSKNSGKVICVFQPHTYSRTAAFFAEFVSCFEGADEIVYLPVYSAREKPQKGVTSFGLFKLAKSQGVCAHYFCTFQRAANYLLRTATQADTVVLIGAGNVNELATFLVKNKDNEQK